MSGYYSQKDLLIDALCTRKTPIRPLSPLPIWNVHIGESRCFESSLLTVLGLTDFILINVYLLSRCRITILHILLIFLALNVASKGSWLRTEVIIVVAETTKKQME